MQKLIHYFHPMSRGMRTQRLLETFQIPHQAVIIDYTKGEHRSEDYLKINPLGRVPALRHDDLIITESGAITLYLADLFPDEMQAPRPGTPERARLYEWVLFFQTTMEQVVLPVYAGGDKEAIKENIKSQLQAVESKIIGPYVMGDTFTIFDVILYVELSWYHLMEIWPSEGLEKYEEFAKLVGPKVDPNFAAKS
jgi:glutathione S-transferase